MIEQPLEPKEGISLCQQLVLRLTNRILTVQLAPGEQLPSVRELAKGTVVKALILVEAYSALEQKELIETRWGKDSFVSAMAPAANTRAAEEHLSALIDSFLFQALPLAASSRRLLGLLRERMQES